jgi:sortase A
MTTLFQTPPSGKTRRQRCIEAFFLLAGVACAGVWGWSVVRESISQRRDSRAFDSAILANRPTIPDSAAGPTIPTPITDGGVVGRIGIPRLHLSAMVRQGTGPRTLEVAVGHIPHTAFPGDRGNVAVAGHRDSLFRGLGNIRRNDLIEFETLRGKYSYRVESTQVVTPDNVSVLNAGAEPELTLVTCYPFSYIGPAPERFIVKARQIEPGGVRAEARDAGEIAVPPKLQAAPRKPAPPGHGSERVAFEVIRSHSRQITAGISIGLTATDPVRHRVAGWVWVMPDRRTIWLRDQDIFEPVVFYGYDDGRRREVTITSVSANSARGYLLVPR